MATNPYDADGPVSPPKRATLTLQPSTARERTDGTIEPDGPGPIHESEISPATRWFTSVTGSLAAAIEAAVQPLAELVPPSPSSVAFATRVLQSRALLRKENWADIMVLLHAPDVDLTHFSRALASAFYRDPSSAVVFDCADPANDGALLFGAPPGYRGCLDGGRIINQLIRRPESVIVLANIEYADEKTLSHLRTLARDNHTMVVAQGAQVVDWKSRDELFVLATTRAFGVAATTSLAPLADDAARKAVLFSMQQARPELDWSIYNDPFKWGHLCAWGSIGAHV